MVKCLGLIIYRKSTKIYELEFSKDEVRIPITDWTIYFTVKTNVDDSDANAIIKKDITAHTDSENGKTEINLSSVDTDLTPKNYYYSIDYKDDEGNEGVLYYGRLTIKKAIRETRT